MNIPFIDLKRQRERIGKRMDDAILRVVNHGAYIMGPEVHELESQLADFCGAKHCVSCANGTDALGLALMAWGIGPGDAVYVPAFTFVATAEVVQWVGATPVFVDVLEDTFNLDPASLAVAIDATPAMGLTPKVVIPVDLFGQPADYRQILPLAKTHGLRVLTDAAQGFGATLDSQRTGVFGDATATSFFPAKPLGCYGDGGAVFTDDDEVAAVMRSLRVHGQGSNKYDNVRVGINGRLDTIQAAVLLEKLAIFPDEIEKRQAVAERYELWLGQTVDVPHLATGATSVWAQYTIRTRDRATMQAACKAAGVPTAVYYPIPLSQQSAYAHHPVVPSGVAVSETLANDVLSLPMHPYLSEEDQRKICEVIVASQPPG